MGKYIYDISAPLILVPSAPPTHWHGITPSSSTPLSASYSHPVVLLLLRFLLPTTPTTSIAQHTNKNKHRDRKKASHEHPLPLPLYHAQSPFLSRSSK